MSLENGILYKSILLPIEQEGSYTVLGTIIYALIALALLYLIYKVVRKYVKFDFKFFFQLIPFIFLGASLRAFVDNGYLERTFWTISPGLYLLISGTFFLSLAVSLLIQKYKKVEYWKSNFILGVISIFILYGFVATKIRLENFYVAFFCITTFLAITYLIFVLFKKLKLKVFKNKLSFSAIASQIFDGTNTSIILAFVSGYEKHPIPRVLIEKTGTSFIFLPIKIIIALVAVYLIYTQIEDKELRNLLLMSIAVLGFAQGLRNLLSLILM